MFVHILPNNATLSQKKLKLNHRIGVCLAIFIVGYFFFCSALISHLQPRKSKSNQIDLDRHKGPTRKFYNRDRQFIFYENNTVKDTSNQCANGVSAKTTKDFSKNFDVRMHGEFFRGKNQKIQKNYFNLVYSMESETYSGYVIIDKKIS